MYNNVTSPEHKKRVNSGRVAGYSRQAQFRAFSANNTHSINFSMAPLLAGQEDTDISSLLETAETRCSNKSDLGGKSEMEEKAY